MSISTDRATLNKLTRDIGELRGKETAEIKKEADANKKQNAANDQARRATSASQRSTYVGTATREANNVESAQTRRFNVSNDIAKKSQEIAKIQERITKAEEVERRTSVAAAEKRQKADEKDRKALGATADLMHKENDLMRKDYERRVNKVERQLAEQLAAQASATAPLPIWHRLTQDDVAKHAPSLAGRLALKTSDASTDAIVAELVEMRDRFKAAAHAGTVGP